MSMQCGCDEEERMFIVLSFNNGKTAEVAEICNNPDHWESNVIVIPLPEGSRVTFDKKRADRAAAAYNANAAI